MDWKPFMEVSGGKKRRHSLIVRPDLFFPIMTVPRVSPLLRLPPASISHSLGIFIAVRKGGIHHPSPAICITCHQGKKVLELILQSESCYAVRFPSSFVTLSPMVSFPYHPFYFVTLSGREGSSFKSIFCRSFVEDALSGPNPPCQITPSPVFLGRARCRRDALQQCQVEL